VDRNRHRDRKTKARPGFPAADPAWPPAPRSPKSASAARPPPERPGLPSPAIRRPVEPAAHPERQPGPSAALTHSNQSGEQRAPQPPQLDHHDHAELHGIGS
jgi:hypothetical protein